VVKERQVLVDGLARYSSLLGLARVVNQNTFDENCSAPMSPTARPTGRRRNLLILLMMMGQPNETRCSGWANLFLKGAQD
jgi:hypothetical protein